MNKKMTIILCVFLLGFILFPIDRATAEEIKLRMSHFMSVKHPQHKVMSQWAQKIGELTNGKVNVKIFPGGALGKPPSQYDAAVKGVTDIAFGLQSYTPGRFPLTTVMDLPFLASSAEQGAIALWKVYEKYCKNEYTDVKVLWLLVHGPGQIYTTNKEVKNMEDLKGLKLCSSGAIVSKILTQLGAVPVTMHVTEFYVSMKQGVTGGVAIPWEGMPPFRLYELCKYGMVADFYTTPFFVVMNKKKYESLPPDVKKVIDENSGLKWSAIAGRAYDKAGVFGKSLSEKKGMKIYALTSSQRENWVKKTQKVRKEWVEEMESKGLPGKEVLQYALDVIAQQ